jgi:hypothetical protein
MFWILGGSGLTTSQADAINSFIALATTPTGQHLAKDASGVFVNTPDTGGAASIAIGSTITGGTVGSILFVGSSGLAQDNAVLFWDDTNNRFGVGTNSPTHTVHFVSSTVGGGIMFERTTSITNSAVGSTRVMATTSGDMTDGFAAQTSFSIKDNAGVENTIGAITSARANGSDNTGSLALIVYNAFDSFLRCSKIGVASGASCMLHESIL